jgi:two-component system OmpR family response regulator
MWEGQPVGGEVTRSRVLVVEAERRLAHGIKRGLEREEFTTDVAFTGDEGLELAKNHPYDAIVLDTVLPGRDGVEVCAALRDAGIWTPIVMLTATKSELDHVNALGSGADDLVTKPFSYALLAARLRAVIGRSKHERPTFLTAGDLKLDPARQTCSRGDVEIRLTPRQSSLLEFFMRRRGMVLSKNEIVDQVWDFGFEGDVNVVEVYVGYLRRKIDTPFARHAIQTIRLVGYRLDPDGG